MPSFFSFLHIPLHLMYLKSSPALLENPHIFRCRSHVQNLLMQLYSNDDRQLAPDIQGCFMRIVVLQIFSKVSGAGRDRSAVPYQAKISLGCGYQIIRLHKSHIVEMLFPFCLIYFKAVAIQIQAERMHKRSHFVKKCILRGLNAPAYNTLYGFSVFCLGAADVSDR